MAQDTIGKNPQTTRCMVAIESLGNNLSHLERTIVGPIAWAQFMVILETGLCISNRKYPIK